MDHYPGHLLMGVTALAVTLLASSLTVNRHVKRKLKLSIFLFAAYTVAQILVEIRPGALPVPEGDIRAFEQLAFTAGVINFIVLTLINPLRVDRVPDSFPSILQDTIVVAILVIIATFVFHEKILTTSAIGAVVVGFALQDTLGNAFAGLAIQSEKPFHVGDWIQVGEFEGRVAEVTWRATKLRTKTGNFVVVPNNKIAQEAITNFTEPAVPTRLHVEVGASYQSTPGDVKAAILEAIRHVPRALETPAPDALLLSFDDSAITYQARFWVSEFEFDDEARDEVRTAIYYAFNRRGIEIPWPIEVGYEREWPEPDPATKQRERERLLSEIGLFARLSEAQRRQIAAATTVRMFGNGEPVVRQGDSGQSMFVVCSGTVAVILDPGRRELATIDRGGYFGEMSLLTGEPRSATVVARGDASVMELDADVFRQLGAADPAAVEQIAVAAMTRRAELSSVRDSMVDVAVTEAPATLLTRMKKFLKLS